MPDVKHFDPDAVLEQVLRLFWRRGAASTGIAEVVAETGISRSSLYATFGGKRDLYLAALRGYVERHSRPVFDRLAAVSDGAMPVAAMWHAVGVAAVGAATRVPVLAGTSEMVSMRRAQAVLDALVGFGAPVRGAALPGPGKLLLN